MIDSKNEHKMMMKLEKSPIEKKTISEIAILKQP